jgi:hypothetical protein
MSVTIPPQHAGPHPALGPWPVLRSAVVTVLVLGIAAAAHTGAGGRLPPLPLMVLFAVLVMAPVTALSRRRLSLPVLGGILATGQTILHLAFTSLSGPGRHCGPAGMAAHSHHQPEVVLDCVLEGTTGIADTVPSGAGSAAMTSAHVLATALTALFLAHAEAALWQLRAWLRPLTRRLQPAALPGTFTVPTPVAASRPRPVPATSATAPRGPPPQRPPLLPAH